MTKTNTKAFTLIELLIVIVIIGILAVALIPRLTGAQASARDTARKASVQQVATAVSQYIAENPTNTTTVTSGTLLTNNYLSSYPADPKGDTYGITIVQSGATQNYVVCAISERPQGGNLVSTTAPTYTSGAVAANATGNYLCVPAR